MTSLKADSSASGTPGKERRIAQRYALDLPARLYLDDNDVLSITVKNFCVGGLYLTGTLAATALQQLRNGSEVTVESALAGDQVGPLRMRARIVRHEPGGAGVAFIDPEPLILQQIHSHIIEMSTPARRPLVSSESAIDYSTVIQRCDQVVMDSIETILDKFCSTVVDTLFEQSQDIKDIRTQNAYFNAMGVLNKSKATLAEWFTDAILKGLERHETATQKSDISLTDISTESLSLVEETDFEDWLAASGIVDSVFSRHRELLNDLHRRLSIIFDNEIDKNNNPYGPMLYANALQEALMQLGLEHVVNLAIYKVLNKVLVSQLGTVYKDVNAILIEQGIQAEEGVILKKEEPAEAQTETESVTETEAAGQTVKPDKGAETQVQGTPLPEQDRQIISPTEALDLYDLVHDLRELRKTVSSSGTAAQTAAGVPEAGSGADIQTGTEAGTGATAEPQHRPNFSSDQVIDALTTIDRRGQARDDGRSIKERVVDALRKTGADGDMAIAEHDDRVIDVTTDIFDSMKHDLQVAAALKLWLEKLEIPLMKIALVDDTIFTDRKHIARDVINKIARLELTGNDNESSVQASINQSLNWLMGLMNNEFDGSSTVFKRVDDQLDLLLQIQNKEYEKNVEKVAESSATNKALNEESEADKLISQEFVARDEKQKEALNRVRRLEEGDWVVFEVNTDDPSRVRVAWIARHTEKLVFVNLLGEKERTISMVELAEQLLEETAVIVDNANDPIMDRAQYSMLQELHERLLHETTHDQLTGLLNRREFEKHLKDLLVQSKANNSRHMLCYMDLDQFDVINTGSGYEAGDALLQQIAEVLSEAVGDRGVVGRIGSDEFGILLENTALEDSIDLVSEYLETIHERGFVWDGKKHAVSMSAGLVLINAQNDSHTHLLQEAEASCRVAKEIGGNRVQVYHAGSSRLSKRNESIKWAAKVDEVIENNGFSLRCQRIMPVINEEEERAHYEILLNVHDSDGSPLALDDFIQAAEAYKRMPAVDRWVVTTAFEWLEKNQDYLGDISTLSINLSGKSINDEDFMYFIEEQISESGVPTEYICFEITETAGVNNLTTAAEFIKRIQKIGCRFSLDDFGSGVSSYGYLKNLPVDYLKIDGMFVRDMANSTSDYAVVKSITEIGHFMGKYVIAEFVENDETLEILRQIGVDYAQGYGVERPVELDALLVG